MRADCRLVYLIPFIVQSREFAASCAASNHNLDCALKLLDYGAKQATAFMSSSSCICCLPSTQDHSTLLCSAAPRMEGVAGPGVRKLKKSEREPFFMQQQEIIERLLQDPKIVKVPVHSSLWRYLLIPRLLVQNVIAHENHLDSSVGVFWQVYAKQQ